MNSHFHQQISDAEVFNQPQMFQPNPFHTQSTFGRSEGAGQHQNPFMQGSDFPQSEQTSTQSGASEINRAGDEDRLKQRLSFMNANTSQPDYMRVLKDRMIDRLSNQRRSLIHNRRADLISQSKVKQMVQEVMEEETRGWTAEEIEFHLQEFEQIQREFHEELARELYLSTVNNEEFQTERYEQQRLAEIEMQAQAYFAEQNDLYNCAVCKSFVHRINGSRLRCDTPNCIDLELGNPNFNIEDVMNLILREVIDHREQAELEMRSKQRTLMQQPQSGCSDLTLRVRLENLNELFGDFLEDEVSDISMDQTREERTQRSQQLLQEQAKGNQSVSLGLMVTCATCSFTGIIQLYD